MRSSFELTSIWKDAEAGALGPLLLILDFGPAIPL
jgi:hypothetical protein